MSLLHQHPLPLLLARARNELSASFTPGPARVARAPARLDVMGGIAEETGSLTCSLALDRPAAGVLVQDRSDGLLQIFSFDELDAHRPFTLLMPINAIAGVSESDLRAGLAEPGRAWAWSVIGAVRQLAESPRQGMNVALLNTVPPDVDLSADAALAGASIAAICGQFSPVQSQQIQQAMLGRSATLGTHVAVASSMAGLLLRYQSDARTPLSPLPVPQGMRWVGIDTGIPRPAHDDRLERARLAATLAHEIILGKMRDLGVAAGRTLVADPMGGFLARLDSNDYKRWFRPYLPERLMRDGIEYPVRGVADHHVLEALRVKNFIRFIEQANELTVETPSRGILLDKAGHLMYASHQSLSGDATLGVEQADLLVRLIRKREPRGLYGARLTGTGRGGVVAVLCEDDERATAALMDVLEDYATQTSALPVTYRAAPIGADVSGVKTILF